MPISNYLPFFKSMSLRACRVHEVSGPSRECFALGLAGYIRHKTAWISDEQFKLNPTRLQNFISPDQFFQMRCCRHEDRLWVMEEVLRSNSFGIVIADISKPLSLLEGRRLQLAAESGKTMGLCLIQPNHGANTAETRWYCEPSYSLAAETDSTHWHWHLKKNKTGTIGAWEVKWNAKTRHVSLVSPLADQSINAQRTA